MQRVFVLWIGLWLSTGLLSCSSDSGKPKPPAALPVPVDNPLTRHGGPFQLDWAMNPLWEDGRAEIAVYDAEQQVDGEPHRFTITQATAKREFNQQYNVSTTQPGRNDVFPVLQVTQQYTLPTAAYPSNVQVCLVFRRDQPVQLHKLTVSVQEWAGSSFKSFMDDGLQYQQQYNSYRDEEGLGQRTLLHQALFEDALPYTLRSLDFAALPTFRASIYGQQQTSSAKPPVLYQARIQVEEAPAADSLQNAWQVRVRLNDTRQNMYWFAKAYPHELLRAATWDGRRQWLKQLRRVPLSTTTPPADSAATVAE
ncbi:hypothetical protein [Hymenobacter pini]|uniref:hypothetical protein n=1 Tax=Hymenobacter pini TaxID=2880879 RepID=UPI001CF15822|nr:hypothetical protein [Hymenobacter pini]MCA8830728.1 hypothetical protein [Hymenobacter pini]